MNTDDAVMYIEGLYRENHDVIRDYLNRMCRNIHLAEDLTSETFERALKAMSRADAVVADNPVAWLRAIAKNLLTDHYRKAVSRREVVSGSPAEAEFDLGADTAILDSELLREAYALLAELTPGQRDVMVLRALNGYTTAETAALMRRSPQAIRSLRHKAVRRLLEIHQTAQAEEPTG